MNIWFTADNHFGHANIIEYCNRPFSSVEEMDELMIEAWNALVGKKDEVWHLGDFCLGDMDVAFKYLKRLNGRVRLVPGGHDEKWIKKVVMPREDRLVIVKFVGKTYTLCHYPMLSWEQSHYGRHHFHGHTHGTIGRMSPSSDKKFPPGQKAGYRVDVGVDCWNYAPVSLDELLSAIRG